MTRSKIFISYSRKDEAEKDTLLSHLKVLPGITDVWSDDRIAGGADWKQEIREAMKHAKVAILLISANFLSSDFILNTEVPTLLKRRESEGLIVFPMIARECAWKRVNWLSQMNVRPKSGRAVWGDGGNHIDQDLTAIVEEIADILGDQTRAPSQGTGDLVNKPIGKYRLINRLGTGGWADVYKAYDSNLYRYVAVKVLQSNLTTDEEFIERFENEATAVANLHHANIIQVYDRGFEAGEYYIVMEYIEGPTLQKELQQRKERDHPFAISETVSIFKALASAVDYAHGKELVHRDLKPGNIMFTAEGQVVLTDFGIARIIGNTGYTITGKIMGTPAYLSPEQANGEPGDERSDIYSLGVILYEMATGQPPFTTSSPVSLLFKHINEPPPPPRTVNSEVPEAVERVILKALSKNPDNRYQTAGEMAEELQGAVVLVGGPEPHTVSSLDSTEKRKQSKERGAVNMNATNREQDNKSTSTHTTHIGSITGPVHTGSGDINIERFSVGDTVSTKNEFLLALHEIKSRLEVARQQDLSEEITDDALTEVEAAEREAKKDVPKAERIIKRLKKAKTILITGVGVAIGATAAANELLALIETAIESVAKIFS